MSDPALPLTSTRVLGTTGVVIAADPSRLAAATAAALAEIDAVDRACSRFRPDSDLSRLNTSAGRAVEVSSVLLDAVDIAMRAAQVTGGDVDPTVGRAIRLLGYDRDFAGIASEGPAVLTVTAAPRWREIAVDHERGTVCVPAGVELDLGATAKAFASDRAAAAAATAGACGVLVGLGGDIAVAGSGPEDGWPVLLADRHDVSLDEAGMTVTIRDGGLATSSTTARRWRRGGVDVHHLIDPRTGRSATEFWRTVTVAAASCVDANIASTAAIIRGATAPEWLDDLGLWARLVAVDGTETLVGAAPGGVDVRATQRGSAATT